MTTSPLPDEELKIRTPIGEIKFSANELGEQISKVLIRCETYATMHNTNVYIYQQLVGDSGLVAQVQALRQELAELTKKMDAFLDIGEVPDGKQ